MIGDSRPSPLHQFAVDPLAQPLDVHSVHKKLGAEPGKPLQRLLCHYEVGEFLPPIGHHEVVLCAASTAQIQHQSVLAHGPHQTSEPVPVQATFTKDVRSHDDMGRAQFKEPARVLGGDPTSDLHPARIGPSRLPPLPRRCRGRAG